MKRVTKAVLPSGGLATRLLPVTKSVPKELLPVIDTPVLHHLLAEVRAAGLTDALVITGRGKDAIANHFDEDPELDRYLGDRAAGLLGDTRELYESVTVHAVRQGGAKGMGHAVLRAEQHIGAMPFAVVTGDDLIDAGSGLLARMVDIQHELGGVVLAVVEVADELVEVSDLVAAEPAGQDGLLRVTDIVKRPELSAAPSRLAVVGRYVLPPEVFDVLRGTPSDGGGEVQLPDAMVQLSRLGVPVHAVPFTGARYDVGTRLGLLQTSVLFGLQRPDLGPELRRWLREVVRAD
ncbi:UTP--glucose-1-phosphate uridylyltransferase [Micromonospora sp. DT43]|uniref:UTP--glucose-1-phosphate uridylyltransferase n=1 Tax=Micromonospora sp. DT43 TaxID=3393440 RepID=UPI003CF8537B